MTVTVTVTVIVIVIVTVTDRTVSHIPVSQSIESAGAGHIVLHSVAHKPSIHLPLGHVRRHPHNPAPRHHTM
jgi:hypothetical protein